VEDALRQLVPRNLAGLLSRRTTVRAFAGGLGIAALTSAGVDAKKHKGKNKKKKRVIARCRRVTSNELCPDGHVYECYGDYPYSDEEEVQQCIAARNQCCHLMCCSLDGGCKDAKFEACIANSGFPRF
jgi:hypothetical protein